MRNSLSSLLNESIKRVSKDGNRYYQGIPGYSQNTMFPSVTTVLKMVNKPSLAAWERNIVAQAIKESYLTSRPKDGFTSAAHEKQWIEQIIQEAKSKPNKVVQESSQFGTKAHLTIDNSLFRDKDAPVTEEDEVAHIKTAFEEWRDASGLTMELRDTVVWSPRYHYAGAVDAVGRKPDGTLVALDWKTSNFISNEYALQVSAYAKALEELTGERITEAWVVKFHKRLPLFETRVVKDLDRSFNTFLNVLELFKQYEKADFYDLHECTNVPSETLSSKSESLFFKSPAAGSSNSSNNNNSNFNHYISSKQQSSQLQQSNEDELVTNIKTNDENNINQANNIEQQQKQNLTTTDLQQPNTVSTTATTNKSKIRFTIVNSGNPFKL